MDPNGDGGPCYHKSDLFERLTGLCRFFACFPQGLLWKCWIPENVSSPQRGLGDSADTTNSTACTKSADDAASCARATASDTTVIASTFDAFVDAVLEALPTLNLPVVTAEIGDTWIWGVQVYNVPLLDPHC